MPITPNQTSPSTNPNTVTYPVQGVDLGNSTFNCADYGYVCQNTGINTSTPCCFKCYDANYSTILSQLRGAAVKVFKPIVWKMFYPNCAVGNILCRKAEEPMLLLLPSAHSNFGKTQQF